MLNRNFLRFVICSVALCVASVMASAQTKEINHDFSSFDAIDIDYEFNVKIEQSRKNYSISLTVDDILADYVQTYVKNHTLFITLDKKSLPSDVKKLYKGRKSAEPVLNAVVSVPENITKVKMSGASTLTVNDEIECKEFEITLKDQARVKKLIVDASDISVSMENKSQADMELYAENVTINTSGSADAGINQNSEHLVLNPSGSSTVLVDGETLVADVTTAGSSKTTLRGKTGILNVVGAGSSNIDAINYHTPEVTAKLSGSCKFTEAATDKLSMDLSGNSHLIFDGEPVINIINIKSSSVSRYENVPSKK